MIVFKNIRLFLIKIYLFFLIFPFSFIYFPKILTSSRIIGIITSLVVCIFLIKNKVRFSNGKFFIQFYYGLFIVLCFCILNSALQKIFDFSIPISMFEYLCVYIPSTLFVTTYLKNKYNYTFQKLILLIINVLIIQSCFVIIMVVSPLIQEFLLSLMHLNGRFGGFYRLRQVGITGFSSYINGYILGMGFFLNSWLIIECKKINYLYVLKSVLLLIGAMLASRTSIILLCPAFFYLIFNMRRPNVRLFFLLLLILIFFVVFYVLYNDLSKEVDYLIEWGTEVFRSVLGKGNSHKIHSVEILEKFYWLPEVKTFLFGDCKYIADDGVLYYMNTDAGYMRMLLYMGFILCSFLYFVILIFYYNIILNIKQSFNSKTGFYFLFLFLSFFIVQYKGNLFSDGKSFFIIIFLIAGYFCTIEKNKIC